jgi:Holliday junction resolvase RusA-like endonuclease
MIQVVIDGEPVPKGRPRFSCIRGKPHVYTDAKTLAAEEALRWQIRSKIKGPPDAESKFVVVLHFHTKSKRSDWDNLSKLVCDALNGFVWKDDKQIQQAHVILTRVTDAKDARTFLTILKADEAHVAVKIEITEAEAA